MGLVETLQVLQPKWTGRSHRGPGCCFELLAPRSGSELLNELKWLPRSVPALLGRTALLKGDFQEWKLHWGRRSLRVTHQQQTQAHELVEVSYPALTRSESLSFATTGR